jgi:opacity protein-like surface antigen
LRKLALFAPVFAFLFFAQFASAQQVDVFLGGGTITSSGSCSDVSGLCPEKGGLYISLGGDGVFYKQLGVNFETAWRATQGTNASLAAFGENYRPILTDFNLLYQPRLGKRLGADLMAGIGAADTRTYEQGVSCSGCYNSSDHFMEHLGGGIRFYPWKHIFVRPEVHYYHIQNNNSVTDNGFFNSNNVVRISASIGYTFGGKD